MTEQDHARRRLPGVGHLPGATFLNDRLSDVVVLLAALPEIVVHLRAIQQHLASVDSEVSRMREGVDRLESAVQDLRGEITELGSGMNEVSAAVGRLEPHISDISRVARPLKHRRNRALAAGRPSDVKALPAVDEEPPLSGFA